MKTSQILLIFLFLPFLIGCQINRQPSTMQDFSSIVQGPSDSGGGDTCNDKLIESYNVDITSLPEFKNYLAPLLEKLSPSNENKKSSSPFEFSAKMKNWYIIDCKLMEIPPERKGLYVETYQTAIHTPREIFIYSGSYNIMADEEKAKLILHEMVMAYYLLKYINLEQICKMLNFCDGDFLKVSGWKMFRPEAYRPLNEEDHQKIRNVTTWLWSQKDNLNKENFSTLLKNNDFDKRFPISSDLGENKSQEIKLQPEVLIRMFKKYKWTNTLPKFCQFNSVSNLRESTCDIIVNSEIRDVKTAENHQLKYLSVKVKLVRKSDKKVFEQEFLYPLFGDKPTVTLHMNKIGNVLNAAPLGLTGNWPTEHGIELNEGLKSKMFFMFLNVSDPNNPEIYKILYQTYVWYSFETVFTERDGVRYKETYGYPSIIPDESETIFVEDELPFLLNGFFSGRIFLRSVVSPE